MALRYKGKPDPRTNRQYDKIPVIPELCTCTFVGVGFSMNNHGCKVHTQLCYRCDRCQCHDYRPKTVKTYPNHWPLCVCGHIAQEHN